MKKIYLAITTFNRVDYLKRLIESFIKFRDPSLHWELIIADDGSTDGTLGYLRNLSVEDTPILIIQNKRKGVHHQFNTIVRELEGKDFEMCFKSDDDMEFIKAGWEKLYLDAARTSGFYHLCFFDPGWRPSKLLKEQVGLGPLVSRCRGIDVQGSFFTLTPDIIKKVGYMDTKNFGFRGVGHVDYTLRACRLGFNDLNHPFDAKGSNEYIRTQTENYGSSLPEELLAGLEDEEETRRKYALVHGHRTYIPYADAMDSMDSEMEKKYLTRAVRSLGHQKRWYEEEIQRLKMWEKEQYGHLPGWYVKIGKIFKIFSR